MRLATLCVALVFSAPAVAQLAATGPPGDPKADSALPFASRLKPGHSVTDKNDVVITNGGTAGDLIIRGTGKLKEEPRGSGKWVTTGTITKAANERTGGSSGPITVDSAGQPITIDLEKTGPSQADPIVTTTTGGNVTVNVGSASPGASSTQNNEVRLEGTGNTVNFNRAAANNTGSGGNAAVPGSGAGSGGTVNAGGSGNTFNSNGGVWTFQT